MPKIDTRHKKLKLQIAMMDARSIGCNWIARSAENDGHENDGPSKCPGMKLTDMKMQDMFQVSEYAYME